MQNKSFQRRHAVQRAADYIAAQIDDGSLLPGQPIPSISKLAGALGMARDTVWKAIGVLKQMEILHGVAGGKVFVSGKAVQNAGKSTAAHIDNANCAFPWLQAAVRMKKDILNGVFGFGTRLPTRKELNARYGIASATLSKVLISLAKEDFIIRENRGYRVPSLTGDLQFAQIAILCYGGESDVLQLWALDRALVRFLETECAKARIQVRIIFFCERNDSLQFTDAETRRPCTLADSEDMLGYLLLVNRRKSANKNLIKMLASFTKPVAIVDETGRLGAFPLIKRSSRIHVFSATISTKPAETVARYLLQRHHTNIAFFSAYHGTLWSKRRLEGLRKIYADAGNGDGVKAFTLEHAQLGDYHTSAAARSDIAALKDNYAKWQKNLPSPFTDEIDPAFSRMTGDMCDIAEAAFQLKPFFDEALKNNAITAWVAANDTVAVMALRFLNAQAVRVPEDIALISFDNLEAFLQYRLTTFDFDMYGLAFAILNYFLHPREFRNTYKRPVSEFYGTIVERATMR